MLNIKSRSTEEVESVKNLVIDKQKILEAIGHEVHLVIIDSTGIVTYVNDKFCSILGCTKNELVGKTYWLMDENVHSYSYYQEIMQTLGNGKVWKGEVKNKSKDGVEFWEAITIIPLMDEKGIPYKYVSIGIEVSRLTQNETLLEIALKDSFDETIKHLENAIFKYTQTPDGRLVFTLAKGKIAEKIGFITEKIANFEIKDFFPLDARPKMEKEFKKAIEGRSNKFEMRLFETDFLVSLSPIIENGRVIEVVGTALDITKQKEAEALIHHMAYHDSLTGLLNRAAFDEKIEEIIQQAKEKNETFAVLFIDLNRFKGINDAFGHRIGDKLLIAVSKRIAKSIEKTDIIARLGGDEGAIILPNRTKVETENIVKHIIKQFSTPFSIDNMELYTSVSIGISMYPQDGKSGEELLSKADDAMYHVKNQKENNFFFFTEELKSKLESKRQLENELQLALEKEQFILYYQPQIDITTKKIFGIEALIRWIHPQKGLISPGKFISLAEETGLIIPIGEWVLRTACQKNKEWQEQGYEPVIISVNVSPRQFMKIDFVTLVKQILQETRLKPQYLELEITEGMTMDVKYTKKVLTSLKELGVNVSIDDFGTGYSSLNYLSKLPIKKLKIDQDRKSVV